MSSAVKKIIRLPRALQSLGLVNKQLVQFGIFPVISDDCQINEQWEMTVPPKLYRLLLLIACIDKNVNVGVCHNRAYTALAALFVCFTSRDLAKDWGGGKCFIMLSR